MRWYKGWPVLLTALTTALAVAQPVQAARVEAWVSIANTLNERYILDFDPFKRIYIYHYFSIESYYEDEYDFEDAYYENTESLTVTVNETLSQFKFVLVQSSYYENIYYGTGDEIFGGITIDTAKKKYIEWLNYPGIDSSWETDIRNQTQISYRLIGGSSPTAVPLPFTGALLAGGLAALGVAARRRPGRPPVAVTGR